ncbi:hypothetical protein RIF29_35498 [Crotalaria pallida]|uniref:Uncharacterized protein n=1 Tax=Crotalaria pallida TaxID=3830 RepID=A0AAN9EC95_CROPI
MLALKDKDIYLSFYFYLVIFNPHGHSNRKLGHDAATCQPFSLVGFALRGVNLNFSACNSVKENNQE